MNLTLDFDPSADESVRLFALATNVGMYLGTDSQSATASVQLVDPHRLSLRLIGADPESLLSLRRILILGGSTMPASLRSLVPTKGWAPLEMTLRPEIRELVSLSGLGELTGDAFFLLVQGSSSAKLYDIVKPVVGIWQRLLRKQGFPYRFDEEPPEGLTTEGIEVYERSDIAVEVATTGYGGGEDGVAALVHGIARELQRAGLGFRMQCWSG